LGQNRKSLKPNPPPALTSQRSTTGPSHTFAILNGENDIELNLQTSIMPPIDHWGALHACRRRTALFLGGTSAKMLKYIFVPERFKCHAITSKSLSDLAVTASAVKQIFREVSPGNNNKHLFNVARSDSAKEPVCPSRIRGYMMPRARGFGPTTLRGVGLFDFFRLHLEAL
jgi:hypothetical protein